MWMNDTETSSIFSSFLSYVFTFMISSYYTLMSLRSESFKDVWHNVFGWLAVVYLVIVFGILSVYPNIENCTVHSALVLNPFKSYTVMLGISILLSWKLCVPALTLNAKQIAEEIQNRKSFDTPESMKPNVIIDNLRGSDDDEE